MRKASFTPDDIVEDQVYDTLVVGAGPCGLAVAARLREHKPSALFTDVEQARYQWVNRNRHRTTVKARRSGTLSAPNPALTFTHLQPSMLVLDGSSNQWMGRWQALFKKLDISHLRSPMFFHPDPSDRDALLAFVHSQGGLDHAAQEIAGCAGRELSKHQKKRKNRGKPHSAMPASVEINERDRKDYFAPTSDCFDAFCKCCIERYDLDKGVLRQETVTNIRYTELPDPADLDRVFTVSTSHGQYRARSVVLAIGAGKPNIPAPFSPACLGKGASHAMQLQSDGLLSPLVKVRVVAKKQTRVVVIGGGLTSAQLAVNAVKAGIDHVHLLIRGPLKIKPFDVDLAWLSKFQNHERSIFWSSDSFEERMEIIARARNGGSITPRYVKLLRDLESRGRLSIHTHTKVDKAVYDSDTNKWDLATCPPIPQTNTIDHVYFATGAGGSIRDLECLSSIQAAYPIDTVGGLPVLTDDLQWRKDIPLFITGRYASLQLGPGAGNLEGARLGAERIVWALEELFDAGRDDGAGAGSSAESALCRDYVTGVGSMFKSLQEVCT